MKQLKSTFYYKNNKASSQLPFAKLPINSVCLIEMKCVTLITVDLIKINIIGGD